MGDVINLGDWEFSPDLGTLKSGGEKKNIEHRAVAALALLVRRQGELVSHQEFVDEVWEGRSVSPNSIAVVIGDLRRALNDDARSPKYIETVSKRGYRLISPTTQSQSFDVFPVNSSSKMKRLYIAILAGVVIALLGVFLLSKNIRLSSAAANETTVMIGEFANDTGNEANAPLQSSMAELVATEIMRYDDIGVTTANTAKIKVYGNIIMWDGHVAVALHAEDTGSGNRVWSGMASGPESKLPAQVRQQFVELAATLELTRGN